MWPFSLLLHPLSHETHFAQHPHSPLPLGSPPRPSLALSRPRPRPNMAEHLTSISAATAARPTPSPSFCDDSPLTHASPSRAAFKRFSAVGDGTNPSSRSPRRSPSLTRGPLEEEEQETDEMLTGGTKGASGERRKSVGLGLRFGMEGFLDDEEDEEYGEETETGREGAYFRCFSCQSATAEGCYSCRLFGERVLTFFLLLPPTTLRPPTCTWLPQQHPPFTHPKSAMPRLPSSPLLRPSQPPHPHPPTSLDLQDDVSDTRRTPRRPRPAPPPR